LFQGVAERESFLKKDSEVSQKAASKLLMRETQKGGVSEKRSISERSSVTAIGGRRTRNARPLDDCVATLSRHSDAIGRFSKADMIAAKAFDSNWGRLRERP
jgi:hypothetical protein